MSDAAFDLDGFCHAERDFQGQLLRGDPVGGRELALRFDGGLGQLEVLLHGLVVALLDRRGRLAELDKEAPGARTCSSLPPACASIGGTPT